MGSFTNINTYAQQTVNFTDEREPGPRIFPPVPLNTVFAFDRPLSEPFPIYMGTQVEQVIRPEDALLNLWINTNDAPGSIVTWENLPTGVGLTNAGGGFYILGPINSTTTWNQIKEGGRIQFTGEGPAVYKVSLQWFDSDEYRVVEWINGTLIPVAVIRSAFGVGLVPNYIFAPRYDWTSEFVFYNLSGKLFTISRNLPAVFALTAVRNRIRGFTFARSAVFTLNNTARRFRSTPAVCVANFEQAVQFIRFRSVPVAANSNTSVVANNVRVKISTVDPINTSTDIMCEGDVTVVVPEMIATSTMDVSAVKTTDVVSTTSVLSTMPNTKFTRFRSTPAEMQSTFEIPVANLIKRQMVLLAKVTSTTQREARFHLSGPAVFEINWGDGSSEVITRGNGAFIDDDTTLVTHTYSTLGDYFVEINTAQPFRFYYPSGVLREVKTYHKVPLLGIDYLYGTKEGNIFVSTTRPTQLKEALTGDSESLPINQYTSCRGMFSNNTNTSMFISNLSQIVSESTNMSYMFFNSQCPEVVDDVSKVTNMEYMFGNGSNIGDYPQLTIAQMTKLNTWNTANVTNMKGMFHGNRFFNPTSLNNWNTSNVTNMSYMFAYARAFNGNISSWDTSKVTDMSYMFQYTQNAFNQNLSAWNTGAVTNMSYMFDNSLNFNSNIGSWNTANVTDMSFMFQSAKAFNSNISAWNTANVTNMSYMFADADEFNQPIGSWNVSNVTNISGMFAGTNKFNQPIGSWNTSKVTNMSRVFRATGAFNQPINSWNTANVTTMYEMFGYSKAFNQPIGSWNTAKVTDMSDMFQYSEAFNQPLTRVFNQWNTVKVDDMNSMFYNAKAFNQNLTSWCVPLIAEKPYLFDQSASAWTLPNSRPIWGTCPA